jgi:sugar lactone lactonase YvrE
MRTFLTRTSRNHTGSFTTSCHFAQDFIGNSLRAVIVVMLIMVSTSRGEDEKPAPPKTPELLLTLPDICPTPDGMAMDADGNIIVACPNYGDMTHPAVLIKIDPKNNVRLWCQMPVHPKTGYACPMGIAFGPDGDLYVCDNQGWPKANDLGRIMRMHVKNGRVVGATVVAHGMRHPNGVRVHKGHIYVTQSMLETKEGEPLVSGVYRFNLDDKGVKVNNTLEDKNLLASIKTLDMDCQYGADGLVFDSKGNLLVANFGDATIHKIVLDKDGKVVSQERLAKDECMKSADGICVDEKDNVYVADFSNNAICVVTPQGKVSVLAASPDCDGSKGGLDQPGEPMFRGKELIITNFDKVTGPDKLNSGHDKPYTISVIKMEE